MYRARSSLWGAEERVRVDVEQVGKSGSLLILIAGIQTTQTRKTGLILHSFSSRIVLVIDRNAPGELIHLGRSEDADIAEVVNTLRACLIRRIAQRGQT